MASTFTLSILLKKGTIKGGGLPNQSYVEILLDSKVVHKTKPAPPPHNFNDSYVMNLENLSNHVITFTVYKKRWTSSGFKMVGDIIVPINDLLPDLNKGEFEKDMPIVASKKNMTLGGSLQFQLKFEEVQSDSLIEELPIIPIVKNWAESIISSLTEFSNPSLTKIAVLGLGLIVFFFWLFNILAWSRLEHSVDSCILTAKSLEVKLAELLSS